jgi:hypothetical protein
MIVEKTKERFVPPTFDSCNTHIISFDLWISKGGVDAFVLLVHFLNDKWEPCHVTIGFIEIANTFGNAITLQVNDLLAKHEVNVCVFAYVKDEGNNLSTMTSTLTFVESYEVWHIL